MNITQDRKSSLEATLTLQVGHEDYKTKLDDGLKNVRKNIELKGFRKGMAPPSLIKKMYGNQILADELDKLIKERLYQYLEENKIDILGQPLPVEDRNLKIDVESTEPYQFLYEIGLQPTFEIDLQSLLGSLEKPLIQVTEEEIQKDIEHLRQRYGSLAEVERAVDDKSIFHFGVEPLSSPGHDEHEHTEEEHEHHHHHAVLSAFMMKDEEVKQRFLQASVGDVVVVENVFEAFERSRDQIARQILGLSEAPDDDSQAGYKFIIETIKHMTPAPLDTNFFSMAGGGATNEEEFIEFIRKDLSAYYEGQVNAKLLTMIKDRLMESLDLPLPDDFLMRWLQLANEKPISKEEIDSEYPNFAKDLRWNLIRNKLVQSSNLQVTEEEIQRNLADQVIHYYMSRGISQMPSETEVSNMVAHLAKDKQYVDGTANRILESKLVEYIKTQVSFVEKPITFEEFTKSEAE